MFTKLKELLPANRLAALAGFIGSVIAALAVLQTSFVPGSPGSEAIAKAVAFLGSVGAGIAVVLKFLEGAQNMDALLVSGVPKNSTVVINESGAPVPGTEGMIDEADLDNEAPHPMDPNRLAGFEGEYAQEQGGRQSLGMSGDVPEPEGKG